MVQALSSEIVDAIRNPPSLDAQLASLQQLKNDIVGHDQRKELVVKQGIVQPLVDILSAPSSKAAGKRSANGVSPQQTARTWTQEDDARLQATLILGSLANGGPAFVKPLLAAGTAKYLLDGLASEAAPKLVTATLQALRSLAAAAALGDDDNEQGEHPIEPFQFLLKQPPTSATARQQQKLAAEIIALRADDDHSRTALANGGVLDTLASLLVSHTVANKHIEYRGSTSHLPSPPPNTNVPPILSAISAIITGSNFRIQSFILSPPIRDLFVNTWADNNTDSRFIFGGPRHGYSHNPTESLLPPLHIPIYKSVSFNAASSAFPALASLQPSERRSGAPFDSGRLGTFPINVLLDATSSVSKTLLKLGGFARELTC